MGAWGIKAMESDEGLDAYDFLKDMWGDDPEKINMKESINNLIDGGWLPENPPFEDFLYDSTAILVAEIILEYKENGMLEYYDYDDNYDEVRVVVEKIEYSKADLEPIILQLNALINPTLEVHEFYELWEETDEFDDWKNHVNGLLSMLNTID